MTNVPRLAAFDRCGLGYDQQTDIGGSGSGSGNDNAKLAKVRSLDEDYWYLFSLYMNKYDDDGASNDEKDISGGVELACLLYLLIAFRPNETFVYSWLLLCCEWTFQLNSVLISINKWEKSSKSKRKRLWPKPKRWDHSRWAAFKITELTLGLIWCSTLIYWSRKIKAKANIRRKKDPKWLNWMLSNSCAWSEKKNIKIQIN